MTAPTWQRAKDVFQAALAHAPEARAAFLDEVCRGDDALRREVDALLASHEEAGGFLSDPAVAVRGDSTLGGRRIGPYLVVGKAGQGGMGVVYEAEDTRLGRRVAVKLLPPGLVGSASARARFEREARAVSALNHPHICTVHDFGEFEGQPFLVMERMRGSTLQLAADKTPLPLERVLELGKQLADALDAAHAAGIVHRDIKPTNIFVTDHGEAKLLDFGLAQIHSDSGAPGSDPAVRPTEEHLTTPGSILGTVTYMSPEQARGEPLDARSDLFSLGVVLYEMATGRPPFDGKTHAEIFKAILADTPASPTSLNPAIPHRLEEVILKALEKDKALRYQHASDLKADLKRLLRDSGTGHVPEPGAVVASAVTVKGGVTAAVPASQPSRSPLDVIRALRWIASDAESGVPGPASGIARSAWRPHAAWAALVLALVLLPWPRERGASHTAEPPPNPQPVVVLMDSPLPGRVYDPRTEAAGGTNADDITDALQELPLVILKENTSATWHREEQVLRQNPDLIVSHLSCLWDARVAEGQQAVQDHIFEIAAERLTLFFGYVASVNPRTRFIVYSRGHFVDPAAAGQWVGDAEARLPALRGRLHAFHVPSGQEYATFRDPDTARLIRERVKQVLGLP